jgi:hypothetical protein
MSRKYKKIVQYVIDSKGRDCGEIESSCLKCPVSDNCGEDDDKHYRDCITWMHKNYPGCEEI